jgi:argininosuccinate lyase
MLHGLRSLTVMVKSVAFACLEQANRHQRLPMPGYTHLQRAVPSSVGLWLGSFAESFADVIEFANAIYKILDSNPLGTAAGYGVNLPLDRLGVAQDLGLARIQINPMAVQNSRGKYELMVLQAASHAMQDLRRLAWDLSLYSTTEFGFIDLPARFTTGSSIMPNKKNPDLVELLRGSAASVDGAMTEIHSVLSLPSGYHRDLQLTKAPLIRGLQASLRAFAIVPELVRGIVFNEQRMADAISPEMFATDSAVDLAASGLPFRQAYLETKRALSGLPKGDIAESLARRVSAGACGDLRLDQIQARLESVSTGIASERKDFD